MFYLTDFSVSPEALKKPFEMKARAYPPKKKLGEIVQFLEDVFKYDFLPGRKQLMEKPKDFFDMKFESDWDEKSNMKWRGWGYSSVQIKD